MVKDGQAPVTLEARVAAMRARRAELDARLHGIEKALDVEHSKDWEEAAVEREGDEVMEGMGQSGLSELHMIDSALARVDAGEYGFCAKCGDKIADARLDVLPFTPLCQKCASENQK